MPDLTRPTDAQLDRWAEGSDDQRITVMARELRELRPRVTALEFERDELGDTVALVRNLALVWTSRQFGYDEDAERQIADGRALLGLLDGSGRPDPHDGDSGRSTGSAGGSNGGSSERVGYILGRLGDLGDWVITDPCIPWADPADAENARADAEGYGVPGVTAHVLAVYREDGTR